MDSTETAIMEENVTASTTDNMEENVTTESSGLKLEPISLSQLSLELGIIGCVFFFALVAFILYLCIAKNPEGVPPEYYMKNRLPGIIKEREEKKRLKKEQKMLENEACL